MSTHKQSSPKLTTGTLVLIQTLLIVVLIFQMFSIGGKLDNLGVAPSGGSGGSGTAPAAPAAAPSPPPAAAPPPGQVVEVSADDDPVKGDPDAPVTIIEFGDFECPFCERFYSQTLGQIQSQYIDTGKVKLVYRDFPLSFHAQAQKSAEASECADEQGMFWEYHDKVFDNQASLSQANLKAWAGELGLDTAQFNDCLDSGKMASEVQKDFTDGQSYGVRGTPAFFINGRMISGAQPFAAFQQAIEAALAE